MKKAMDNPDGVPPPPPGRFSHVARIEMGDTLMLILSGQCSVDDDFNVVAPGDIRGQSERIFDVIGTMLAAHGASFVDVVNIRTYLTNIDDRGPYAEVRNRYLPADQLPTSTTVEVSALFLPDAVIEVEVTAVLPLAMGE